MSYALTITIAISTLLIFTLKTDGGVLPTSRNLKLSEVEWNNYNYREPTGSGTYAFGYEVEDPQSSNVQYRNEEKHPNGSVTGSYGYLMPDGNVQTVNYIADENGYRASVKVLPRGNIKPVQLGASENVLFDFSANLPPKTPKSTGSSVIRQINQQFPYNVPTYISAHLENQNGLLEHHRSNWNPYFSGDSRTPVTFSNNQLLRENYHSVLSNPRS